MNATVKALINRTNRTNKSGNYSIYLRVTLNRKSRYFNIGLKIMQKYWRDKEGSWIKENHPGCIEINQIISIEVNRLREYILKQRLFKRSVSLRSISEFYNKTFDGNSFNSYLEAYIKERRFGSLSTRKKYTSLKNHLQEFNAELLFGQINESLLQDLMKWMSEKKNLSGVTIKKYFDAFKKVCKDAVKDGFFERDPFEYTNLKYQMAKKPRVYLNIDEIKLIKNSMIDEYLQDTRIHWLFCFYAGFYYSDLIRLQWKNIVDTEYGYCIIGSRFKNSNEYVSPIHRFTHALEILESKKGKHDTLVFPNTISEQKYNVKLKQLATALDLGKNLMNKTARHSYIQFWEASGLSTSQIAKMVGHTNEKTTKEYYDLSATDINSAVSTINLDSLNVA